MVRSRRRRFPAAFVAAALVAAATRGIGADTPTEWEVKAAYLYNFARFVEWPESASQSADGAFVVGVLGPDPFGRVLDDTIAGKTIGGRPIAVRRLERIEEAGSVQILFLSAQQDRDLTKVLRSLQGSPVLTVGDAEGLVQRGVILNFRIRDNRVRFEVNLAQAAEAHLRVSSQLLKLAIAVEGK